MLHFVQRNIGCSYRHVRFSPVLKMPCADNAIKRSREPVQTSKAEARHDA